MDTNPGTTWDDFKEIIQNYGFEILSERHLWGMSRLFAAHRKGLLLYAKSTMPSHTKRVGSGYVHGTLDTSGRSNNVIARELYGCNRLFVKQYKIAFSCDVRNGLILKLNKIEKVAPFTKWETENWLSNEEERQLNEFIPRAPDWIKEFLP
jgi:hypothetical protein